MTSSHFETFFELLSSDVRQYIVKRKRSFPDFERRFNDIIEIFEPDEKQKIFPNVVKSYNLKEYLKNARYNSTQNKNYFDISFHKSNYKIYLSESANNNPGNDDTAYIKISSTSLVREDDKYLHALLPKVRETIASDRGFCSAQQMLSDLWSELGFNARENLEEKCIKMTLEFHKNAELSYDVMKHIEFFASLANEIYLFNRELHFGYIQNRRKLHRDRLEEIKREKDFLNCYDVKNDAWRMNNDMYDALGGITF